MNTLNKLVLLLGFIVLLSIVHDLYRTYNNNQLWRDVNTFIVLQSSGGEPLYATNKQSIEELRKMEFMLEGKNKPYKFIEKEEEHCTYNELLIQNDSLDINTTALEQAKYWHDNQEILAPLKTYQEQQNFISYEVGVIRDIYIRLAGGCGMFINHPFFFVEEKEEGDILFFGTEAIPTERPEKYIFKIDGQEYPFDELYIDINTSHTIEVTKYIWNFNKQKIDTIGIIRVVE